MKKPDVKEYLPSHLALAVAVTLLIVNIVRILNVTITHDEALTYDWYVTHSYHEIISNYLPSANNHYLNTILAKLFTELFTDNLFFLRLPGLLAHIVYLVLSMAIARKLFANDWWALFCFLLLQLNPFMFEFWGLSRGYGLSISFMMGAVYSLFLFREQHKLSQLIAIYICLFLAVISNFTALHMTITISLIIFLFWLQNRRTPKAGRWIAWPGIFVVLILLAVYEPARLLLVRDQFYYGGDTGFVQDTLRTLISESFYLRDGDKSSLYISWILVFVICLSGLYWLTKAIKGKAWLNSGLVLLMLLTVPAFSTILQHHLLGSKFLIDRTALFLYPLFVLYAGYTIYQAGIAKNILIGALLLILGANFLKNLNLSHTRSWEYDKYDRWLMERMVKIKKEEDVIKIYLDPFFAPAFKYYAPRDYPGKFGYIAGWGEKSPYIWEELDFCVVRKGESREVPDYFVLDTVFAVEQFHLFRRRD